MNGASSESKECNVLDVTVKSRKSSWKISMIIIEVPTCSEVVGQQVSSTKKMYSQLRNSEFAYEGLTKEKIGG